VGGPSTPVPLACDLDDDCSEWFYTDVSDYVLHRPAAEPIEAETRTAHYLGVEQSGSELDIDMPGGGPADDTEPLFGQAEYTSIDCGDDVCPFYLANMSAFNPTDTWDIKVSTVDDKPPSRRGRVSRYSSRGRFALARARGACHPGSAMDPARRPVMTEPMYLAMERAAEVKHEFHAGEVWAMAGASPRHNRLAVACSSQLDASLRGGSCIALSSDQRVHVPATGGYCYPKGDEAQ
jgi:hypothetical protein